MSKALASAALERARSADIIHDHGLWLMPNVYAGRAAAIANRPLIITPRGMLAPEALLYSRRKKMLFWHAVQKHAFAAARCYHATSEAEYREIRSFGIGAPVAVIPNGVDIPPVAHRAEARVKTLLYVGRLHPKKNLAGLIRAWASIESKATGWRMRIIGPDEGGHRRHLQAMVEKLGLRNVTLEKAVYGEEKLRLYRQASMTILPSHNENFGLTVAEALAAASPVIASRGTPWSGLEVERCGWWVENDSESLAQAIGAATRLPADELNAMGERGRRWVERDFSWAAVAEQMGSLYRWILGSGDRPPFVRLN